MDLLQFAYRYGKGSEDATLTILDIIHIHLEKGKSHARILFVAFSSVVQYHSTSLTTEEAVIWL